jgi:predicted CoA-binding protein
VSRGSEARTRFLQLERKRALGLFCMLIGQKVISARWNFEDASAGKEAADMIRGNTREILEGNRVVAVVGLSRDPSKYSNVVAKYLQSQGYQIIPVNPTTEDVPNEKSYRSLLEIPAETAKKIEIVDIFRPSADIPLIVDQAISLRERYGKPYVIWMQLGIINEQAAKIAREAGLTVVMNKCMMQEPAGYSRVSENDSN